MSEQACCGEGASTLIFACSGASNVGQIANDAAQSLSRSRLGTMSCIAAIGAHLDGFTVSARDCDQLVVIDGCDQQCAFKTFEHQGVTPHVYVELTAHGFEKKHGVVPEAEEVERAREFVAGQMKGG
jgi:uncharacterized metal-binding protein